MRSAVKPDDAGRFRQMRIFRLRAAHHFMRFRPVEMEDLIGRRRIFHASPHADNCLFVRRGCARIREGCCAGFTIHRGRAWRRRATLPRSGPTHSVIRRSRGSAPASNVTEWTVGETERQSFATLRSSLQISLRRARAGWRECNPVGRLLGARTAATREHG